MFGTDPARGGDPPIQVPAETDVTFPRRAVPLASAVLELSTTISLTRSVAGGLTLSVRVPPELFGALVVKLAEFRAESRVYHSADVLAALREFAPPELLRVPKSGWDRLNAAARRPEAAPRLGLSPAELKVAHAALVFVSNRRIPLLAATPLEARVFDGSRPPLAVPPGEAHAPAQLRERIEAAARSRPAAGAPERWSAKLAAAQDALSRYEQVFTMHTAGDSAEAISRATGIETHTVRRWLKGHVPRPAERFLELGRSRKIPASLAAPREHSPPFAALLGSYQAGTWKSGLENRVILHFADERAARAVRDHLAASGVRGELPIETVTRRGRSLVRLKSHGRDLACALADITARNERVPWEALGTADEKLAYLRAYLGVTSKIMHRRFCAESRNHPKLLVGIASLLEEHDIAVDVLESPHPFLNVPSEHGIAALNRLGLLTHEQSAALAEKIARGNESEHPCAAYDRVMEYVRINPACSTADIVRELGVPLQTAFQWTTRGVVPRAVKARRNLAEWRELLALPKPGVVPYLYRVHGMAVGDAEKIGAKLDLPSVERALAALADSGRQSKDLTVAAIIRAAADETVRPRREG